MGRRHPLCLGVAVRQCWGRGLGPLPPPDGVSSRAPGRYAEARDENGSHSAGVGAGKR